MKVFAIYAVIFSLGFSAHAELRTWQDNAGHKYEAEFVRELFDQVTLQDAAGKEYRIAVEDLSEHDQKYIRVMVPPPLEINVKTSIVHKPSPWDLFNEDNPIILSITGQIAVQKTSRRPFTGGLTAEFYLIGRDIDAKTHVLLNKTEAPILFTEQNSGQCVFKSDTAETRIFTEDNKFQRRGEEYVGYLLVIADANGKVLDTRSNVGDWITDPNTVAALRELAIRGAASVRSRYFDKTGHKAEVPRPKPYSWTRW